MNNSLTKKKGAEEIQAIVFDSITKNISYLYEMPLEYEMSLKQNPLKDNYIIKFSLSSYGSGYRNEKVESENCIISFQLYSIVTEDVVMKLKEKMLYNIKGKFEGAVNYKIKLPSGNYFGGEPEICKKDYGNQIVIDLGSLYVEDIVIDDFYKDIKS